jgi:hypothetical protein
MIIRVGCQRAQKNNFVLVGSRLVSLPAHPTAVKLNSSNFLSNMTFPSNFPVSNKLYQQLPVPFSGRKSLKVVLIQLFLLLVTKDPPLKYNLPVELKVFYNIRFLYLKPFTMFHIHVCKFCKIPLLGL